MYGSRILMSMQSGNWGAFVARPKKEIDQKEFEKLCALQCTKAEIAGFFNVSEDTSVGEDVPSLPEI